MIQYPYFNGDNPNGKNGQKLAEKLKAKIEKISDIKRICELGCGNGYFVSSLKSAGYGILGIDASVSGIEYAKKNYGKWAQFLCREISPSLSSEVGEGNFDLVIAIETIEHLFHPSYLIETAKALLRPNGYLLLTTPYHGYLKYLVLGLTGQMDKHLNPLYDCGHIKFFSTKTLSQLISKCGFKNVQFEFFGRFPGLWKSMICMARKP